jgi:hypothetical protein
MVSGWMRGLCRSLLRVENYAVINYCGFGKILKKHDKITKLETKVQFLQSVVHPTGTCNSSLTLHSPQICIVEQLSILSLLSMRRCL